MEREATHAMQPRRELITIRDNVAQIKQALADLVLQPRLSALKWSGITRQTPNIKVGYPGQHLASLIAGMEGERTGARGNDLCDGSEVKSCSRIDQLDICESCGAAVARVELLCPACNSDQIQRKNDSKWLFTIRSKDDLKLLTEQVPRIVFLLGDYPYFEQENYDVLRFQAFEIWPRSPRQRRFAELMSNYYHNIYRVHKNASPNKTPAPKNFWPYSYQFYICNPIRTFACEVHDANSRPRISLLQYIEPDADRSASPSVAMPRDLIEPGELNAIVSAASVEELRSDAGSGADAARRGSKQQIAEHIREVGEALRNYLPLRDDRTASARTRYSRRTR